MHTNSSYSTKVAPAWCTPGNFRPHWPQSQATFQGNPSEACAGSPGSCLHQLWKPHQGSHCVICPRTPSLYPFQCQPSCQGGLCVEHPRTSCPEPAPVSAILSWWLQSSTLQNTPGQYPLQPQTACQAHAVYTSRCFCTRPLLQDWER